MTSADTSATPLTAAANGVALRVVHTDTHHLVRRRLAELGIRPGAVVRVLHATHGRGRVLAVAGSRVAVDRSVLAGIWVSPVAGG